MCAQFVFEDCLLKHYVRTEGWLPLCKDRKKKVNVGRPSSKQRRLRYFTFCAIGAIDVLMLDVASVIRPSGDGRFDTVVFFDRDPESVNETQKRIPGAIGFPGRFTEVVLLHDPAEGNLPEDILAAPADDDDQYQTRKRQIETAQRRMFIEEFPFDIINLDLEEFLFKPNDEFPGKVINSLRKVFAWQRQPFSVSGKQEHLDGFSLMFTTQVGPPNMSAEYLEMLRRYLRDNLRRDNQLQAVLEARFGTDDLARFEAEAFPEFFKLGVPKVLAGILMEQDWYVDPELGIRVFQFERQSKDGPYTMLHIVMDVKRQDPPIEKRAPNAGPPAEVDDAYLQVCRGVFERAAVDVNDAMLNKDDLRLSLTRIKQRRRKYYPEADPEEPENPAEVSLFWSVLVFQV